MACDLQFTDGTTKWKGKTKIYKFKAHPLIYPVCDFIVGFAGTASDIISVAEFFSMPDVIKPPRIRGIFRGLVLTEEQDIFTFDHYAQWLAVNDKYAACGSGQTVALGAMAAGASPKEAIKHASKHDAFTGFGVKTLKF